MLKYSSDNLKIFTGKWTIFTILKIKLDDLLFEKVFVFSHKKICTLAGCLIQLLGGSAEGYSFFVLYADYLEKN